MGPLAGTDGARPRLFVGSSAEALAVAQAVQLELDRQYEVVIWHQGIFDAGLSGMESLSKHANSFDFALLIFSADDMVQSRGEWRAAPRDNVVFEAGLFMGLLGCERVFVLCEERQVKVPSDLFGVTTVPYRKHGDGNLQASVGAPCTAIKARMGALGFRAGADIAAALGEESATGQAVPHDGGFDLEVRRIVEPLLQQSFEEDTWRRASGVVRQMGASIEHLRGAVQDEFAVGFVRATYRELWPDERRPGKELDPLAVATWVLLLYMSGQPGTPQRADAEHWLKRHLIRARSHG